MWNRKFFDAGRKRRSTTTDLQNRVRTGDSADVADGATLAKCSSASCGFSLSVTSAGFSTRCKVTKGRRGGRVRRPFWNGYAREGAIPG
jgi:hypothetical protein